MKRLLFQKNRSHEEIVEHVKRTVLNALWKPCDQQSPEFSEEIFQGDGLLEWQASYIRDCLGFEVSGGTV